MQDRRKRICTIFTSHILSGISLWVQLLLNTQDFATRFCRQLFLSRPSSLQAAQCPPFSGSFPPPPSPYLAKLTRSWHTSDTWQPRRYIPASSFNLFENVPKESEIAVKAVNLHQFSKRSFASAYTFFLNIPWLITFVWTHILTSIRWERGSSIAWQGHRQCHREIEYVLNFFRIWCASQARFENQRETCLRLKVELQFRRFK